MPVRFRCVYCNQLLGISRRKAGMVVRCTNCGGQIIVPEPEPRAEAVSVGGQHKRIRAEVNPAKGNLFDRGDINDLLKPFSVEKPALMDEPTARTPSSQEMLVPPANPPVAVEVPRPITEQRIWLLVAFGVGIAITAFIAGYFVGKL